MSEIVTELKARMSECVHATRCSHLPLCRYLQFNGTLEFVPWVILLLQRLKLPIVLAEYLQSRWSLCGAPTSQRGGNITFWLSWKSSIVLGTKSVSAI